MACADSSTVPHSPTHFIIVSGANQSGRRRRPLAQPLVVEVRRRRRKAGGERPADLDGDRRRIGDTGDEHDRCQRKSRPRIGRLAPTIGAQVVTATSAQITGVSASFVANNGSTITGSVTSADGSPFGANFSRFAYAARASLQRATTRHPSSNRIIVGFKDGVLGVAAAGSNAYRSMAVARQTMSRLQTSVAALAKTHAMSRAEISPSMVAARMRVTDTSQIEAVMQSLRTESNVAWVERDEIISIRDGVPRPMSRARMRCSSNLRRPPINTACDQASKRSVLLRAALAGGDDRFAARVGDHDGKSERDRRVGRHGHSIRPSDIAANLTNDGYDFVSQWLRLTANAVRRRDISRRSTETATARTPIPPIPTILRV